MVTTHFGTGVATLAPSPNFIGLVSIAQPINANVSLSASQQFIGLVSVAQPLNANVSLSASAAFIGLATIIPTYLTTYTSLSTVISALATLVVPPSGQRIILKDLFVSSLGRTEVGVWAARSTTTINKMPPSALSTTSGYTHHFGDSGMRWSAADDALTFSSGSTIGVMVNVRFE